MSEACTVSYEGDQGAEYFVSCEDVKYLTKKELRNTSSRTIYLYRGSGQNRFTITIQSGNIPFYSDRYSTYYITNISNVKFNAVSEYYRGFDSIKIVSIAIFCLYFLTKMMRFKR